MIKLAPGIQLTCENEASTCENEASRAIHLVSAAGKVHLNQHALCILELCDGTRSRDRVVVDAMVRAGGGMQAADVARFLEAAQARGWIVEAK